MRQKGEDSVGNYNDAFSPVLTVSGFRTILSLATQQNMFTDHVDISQAFVQGELLPRDGHNGKVHIFSPPGYDEEILRTWNFWNATPRLTPMQPNTRLNKDDCDKRILPLISIDVIVVLSVA